MNKITCNKNVSWSNKKEYWHPAWATELKMVTYPTCCSIRNDQNTCECKKELCHVWPSGKIIAPFLTNSSFHGVFWFCQLGAQLPSNHTNRPTDLAEFRHCSYGTQFAIGFTTVVRPQKEEPQMVGITALTILFLYLVLIISFKHLLPAQISCRWRRPLSGYQYQHPSEHNV